MDGVRSAAVVALPGPAIAVTISAGGRATIDREVPLDYLATVVSWIDPEVEVVLAEDYVAPGAPAVEVRPAGAAPLEIEEGERFAVVDPAAIAEAFAQHGPGYTGGVAERIQRELLGREPAPRSVDPRAVQTEEKQTDGGGLGRLFRRLRGG